MGVRLGIRVMGIRVMGGTYGQGRRSESILDGVVQDILKEPKVIFI